MKAVVFGGSGFLGSHVADALTEQRIEVVIFDLKVSNYIKEQQKMVIGNILDIDSVTKAVEGADYVYNFAGIADLDNASTRPSDTVLLNVLGTCNIIEACIKAKVKRFIYASSFYANSEKGGFYRCSKQAAEIYIEEFYRKYGMDYTILRYGSLYGPHSDGTNGIYSMLRNAVEKGVIHYTGTGDEKREYIHVVDAAKLSVKILDEEYANKHIVLTGHDTYRIKEVVAIISEVLNKPINMVNDGEKSNLHYNVTPYTFNRQQNYKLVSDCYHDIGQGLVECLMEMYPTEENLLC